MIRERQAARYVVPAPPATCVAPLTPARAGSRAAIPQEDWPKLVARAEREGLRGIARDLGVSHEAVRTALRAAGRADLLADPTRRRRLEAAAPPPPAPPRKLPPERHAEVRRLCERHTQAEAAALLGVSQATVWRILHGRRH